MKRRPVYRDQAHPDFDALRRLLDGPVAVRLDILWRWNEREWDRLFARIGL